jgi:hypothetical protein
MNTLYYVVFYDRKNNRKVRFTVTIPRTELLEIREQLVVDRVLGLVLESKYLHAERVTYICETPNDIFEEL